MLTPDTPELSEANRERMRRLGIEKMSTGSWSPDAPPMTIDEMATIILDHTEAIMRGEIVSLESTATLIYAQCIGWGLSTRDLAEHSGVPLLTISQIMDGHIEPSDEDLAKIAHLLMCKPEDLRGEVANEDL